LNLRGLPEQLSGKEVMMEISDSQQKIEEVIRVLEGEITRLRAQRADISNRIVSMSQIVVRLSNLNRAGECPSHTPDRGLGVTRACRLVLMESKDRQVTFCEVFRAIQTRLAPDMFTCKEPRASVATILGRLVKYGEVKVATNEEGKRTYRWSDQEEITRQSYELVVPGCSAMNRNSVPAEEAALE
jgi:hypothetical protein